MTISSLAASAGAAAITATAVITGAAATAAVAVAAAGTAAAAAAAATVAAAAVVATAASATAAAQSEGKAGVQHAAVLMCLNCAGERHPLRQLRQTAAEALCQRQRLLAAAALQLPLCFAAAVAHSCCWW